MRLAASAKPPSATLPDPICRHFGACGGCALQDLSLHAYRDRKRRLIVDALARCGISDPLLTDIVGVPPCSRRRATLKVQRTGGAVRIGFHAPRSHELIDIHECHVLTPGLFRLTQALRELFAGILREHESAELRMLDAENGLDLAIAWRRRATPDVIARIAAAASKLNLIRITSGGELLYESAIPEVRFGNTRVKVPPGAFLQPTREGEAVLQARVAEAVGPAKKIADLFSGCGTFALTLAERAQIHAADADAPLLDALAAAGRGTSGLKVLSTERRDLFKRPLAPAELNRFEAVALDPPRAGALVQAKNLSQSRVPRIAYVSCDAASFARDARILIDGGFRLAWLVGIDQFLWSAHIELAAAFTRN
jgi:23S rRNA (uracil1939-C5)-methyltransferase